jgi:hypothetical protein
VDGPTEKYDEYNGCKKTAGLIKYYIKYNRPAQFLHKKNDYYVIEFEEKNSFSSNSNLFKKKFNTIGDRLNEKREPIRDYSFVEQKRKCKLYQEFEKGSRYLDYIERYGLMLNMIQIKGGAKKFLEVLDSLSNEKYDSYKEKDWSKIIKYNREQGYYAKSCDNFCSHCDKCSHGANIILTVKNFKK